MYSWAAVSTAGRLKYADPRSLPSYPSHGLRPDGAAASAAATLGWASHKPVECWKPDETSSAFAAAVLAKNYKMSPSWEPSSTSDGAKAAVLAVNSADAALKRSSSARVPKSSRDGWGNSAATQAFHAAGPTASPASRPTPHSHGSSAATQAFAASRTLNAQQANTQDNAHGDRSLAAAKGAMSVNRPRAISSPSADAAPKESRAATPGHNTNALNGATLAHRASMASKSPSKDAGAVPVTTMTRNMFTSRPQVQIEVDERTRNEQLHQSAVAMAKKMYGQQQKMVDQTKEAYSQGEKPAQVSPYLSLQDAAYKQAQERLAKLHDEHQRSREYQEYYGNTQTPKRRFSMAARLRRRSSSDGDLDDREQSRRIKQEMSMFSTKLSQVDSNKRDKDREALLAAAQRNVKARLQGMDEKAYSSTGKPHHAMLSDWEIKAQRAAQIRHESRTENKGKIDIGGGKFMDPDEVNAIASKSVQPVLDDINEKAEIERERLAVLKLEEEAKKAEEEKQKARDREIKEINRKAKEEEKQEERNKKQQERQEERTRKDEEKAAKAEQKRMVKEEKRKSKAEPQQDLDVAASGAATEGDVAVPDNPLELVHPEPMPDTGHDTTIAERRKSGEGPTSPKAKVKGWIKNRFSRGKSIGEQGDKKRGFLGGAALRQEASGSSTSLDNRPTSMRDVAMAGRGESELAPALARPTDSRGVSPASDTDSASTERYDDYQDTEMSLPRPLEDPAIRGSQSPTRDSRFREMMDR
ncbi:hypothetical protein B0I35DRAFT_451451 [Stachybotrys elegans]|uniref:Eisosome protein 1 n=1 Tax=Stachybotrys elegans TaxID=80388 RepID=A0A8K0WQV6_9HYPO|nr:hypothetical protein B0I35DRAFT_451451 [Stachybotrys elegans]